MGAGCRRRTEASGGPGPPASARLVLELLAVRWPKLAARSLRSSGGEVRATQSARLENSSHSQVRCEQRRRLGSPRPSMARLEEDGLTENSIASAAPVARMPEAEFPIPGRRAPSTHLSGCRRTCREALRRCAQHGGPWLVRLRSDRVRHRRLRRRRHGGAYGARLLVGAAAAASAAAALQRCGWCGCCDESREVATRRGAARGGRERCSGCERAEATMRRGV